MVTRGHKQEHREDKWNLQTLFQEVAWPSLIRLRLSGPPASILHLRGLGTLLADVNIAERS